MVPGYINRWSFLLYDASVRISSFFLSWLNIRLATSPVVGIFSRDDCFPRLVKELQAQNDIIREVKNCHITNNGERRFRDCVSCCDFAILYHSMTRGRLNITDVTDALYDKELHYLSTQLGKDNVVVVADDLEDSGLQEKERILGNQPSLKKYAGDLILFSRKEKGLRVTQNCQDAVGEKLQHLLALITATMLPFYIITEDRKLNGFLRLVIDFLILPVMKRIQRKFPFTLVYGRIKPITMESD